MPLSFRKPTAISFLATYDYGDENDDMFTSGGSDGLVEVHDVRAVDFIW
jgi:hypothetical protein